MSFDLNRLKELAVGLWGGFVFVNFDPDAAPLEEFMGVLPEHFKDFHIEDRYIESHIQKRLPVNWKSVTRPPGSGWTE